MAKPKARAKKATTRKPRAKAKPKTAPDIVATQQNGGGDHTHNPPNTPATDGAKLERLKTEPHALANLNTPSDTAPEPESKNAEA